LASGGRQAEIYTALQRIVARYGPLIRERFPKIRRRVSGYNLDELLPENGFNVARALVGSEGTCALTLQAEVRLVKSPRHRVLVVRGFPDVFAAGDAIPEVLAARPLACEGLDEAIIGGLRARGLRANDIALLPPGKAWLMIEFGGDTPEEATEKARAVPGAVIADAAVMTRLWTLRETGASATALNLDGAGPDPIVGWEDAAVDPMRLGDYLREFSRLVERFGYRTSIYGHFGDGCVHARINFDLRTEQSVAHWREFLREASLLVVRYGGSLSGEHGDGHARAEFLPLMFGPELMQAFREFKAAWDPQNRMNPGKIVDPFRVDEHLRLGPQYRPVALQTRLAFRTPEGDGFARAVGHCVGMGKCRAAKGGTMCPSYRATREERYSTRGRARLLGEMLRGELLTEGWRSDAVKDALDWCLGCKGCRSDCPTHTDMAAYKAEFMSHYYESRRRPRQAWSMGRIGEWAPLAERFPKLVNRLADTAFAKGIAGIAAERAAPRFAQTSFRSTFNSQKRGEPVVLLDDCFNNHFRPATARAAQTVLERAGFAVELPASRVCCGRPYYDFGMLDHARRALERVLATLAPQLGRATPVVVLEPGCLSVFRDELAQLFPDDERAARLRHNAVSLGELLHRRQFRPTVTGRILMHAHCHQKALWGTADDVALIRSAGAQLATPDTGCCGMAGSFGMRPEFYSASERIARLALLPALEADKQATVLANGFSCREQIEALAARRTWHIAEVLAAA
jgi:Fe-S oxidoreductase